MPKPGKQCLPGFVFSEGPPSPPELPCGHPLYAKKRNTDNVDWIDKHRYILSTKKSVKTRLISGIRVPKSLCPHRSPSEREEYRSDRGRFSIELKRINFGFYYDDL